MDNIRILESDLWQSLELSEKKLAIAIKALKDIGIWNDGLQETIEEQGAGISMWRGCVATANIALENIDKII